MRRLILLAMLIAAVPAAAQPRRQTAPTQPAPAQSIWGRDTVALTAAFDRVMMRLRYTTRMDAVLCDITTTLACTVEVRGIELRITGQVTPEEVREVRVPFTRSTRFPDVAMLTHALLEIAEPSAPEAERRSAVLRLLGVDSPRADRIVVGRTEVRFVDGFREKAFQFRMLPDR